MRSQTYLTGTYSINRLVGLLQSIRDPHTYALDSRVIVTTGAFDALVAIGLHSSETATITMLSEWLVGNGRIYRFASFRDFERGSL